MSARRTRGGDLKDSKEEGGEEAVAESEATSESGMKMVIEHAIGSDATDVMLNTGANRDSKKRRVSKKAASNDFLDSASATATATSAALGNSSTDSAGKVGGGTMHCGAAAGQASTSASTAHSAREMSVDDAHISADRIGVLNRGESVSDAAETETILAGAAASHESMISSMARANETNIITAENFYLLHWLYRIRNVSCLRGLRISFLQPDFLWSIYRPMMRCRKLWRTDDDIRVAADLWCFDRAAAEERYGHISDWDVSSVTDMSELFQGPQSNFPMQDRYRGKGLFNDDIRRWDVSNVTNMYAMFANARSFNQPIGGWDVSKVTNMSYMFRHAQSFNQSVGGWDVSNVTKVAGIFSFAHSFNQPIGYWDVSKVTVMGGMFASAQSFNQPVGDRDVSNVTDMKGMFCEAHAFNQPVGDWDVSKVTDMSSMFYEARSFNQPIEDWDVPKVTTMYSMLCGASSFNQPFRDWDMSEVTNMSYMFCAAQSFNQDLTMWDMSSVVYADYMFRDAHAMQRDNKPAAVMDDVFDEDDD